MSEPTETSPFAAPAQTAAAPTDTTPQEVEYGDTSFLDNTDSQEPLVMFGTYPAVLTGLTLKFNEETKKQSIFMSVQLYGEDMKYDNGTPVPQGKRLTTTLYAPLDTPDKQKNSERKLKNLLLALANVPLDGKEKASYAAWPPQKKIGFLPPDEAKKRTTAQWSFHALQPEAQWIGTKVMAQVGKDKDPDGNPRNGFTLLAASTPAKAKKGSA